MVRFFWVVRSNVDQPIAKITQSVTSYPAKKTIQLSIFTEDLSAVILRSRESLPRLQMTGPELSTYHIPQFAASKVTSFDIGTKYRYHFNDIPVDLSAEFSRFTAGPAGAPWEKQDQLVIGSAWFVRPSVKLFSEYIHTEGYAPLNFISGGHTEGGDVVNNRSHSDRSAQSDILMIGANMAF